MEVHFQLYIGVFRFSLAFHFFSELFFDLTNPSLMFARLHNAGKENYILSSSLGPRPLRAISGCMLLWTQFSQLISLWVPSSYIFFLSFWHHSEQLWEKLFFPLKKSKYFNFHQFWGEVRWGEGGSQRWKIFLCISGRIRPF